MQINRAYMTNCGEYHGVVVVIDVIRAFTTAAVALSRGAREIILVSEVADALELRARDPSLRVMGEVNGAKPPAFDFSNSPAELDSKDLTGCTLVQRTTAGTQGIVRSVSADVLVAGSLVCAAATVRYLHSINASEITFVITGKHSGADGNEDMACADYLESLLQGMQPDQSTVRQRVLSSTWGSLFGDPRHPELPVSDIDYFLAIDRFDFAMTVTRRGDRLILNSLSAA